MGNWEHCWCAFLVLGEFTGGHFVLGLNEHKPFFFFWGVEPKLFIN